MSFAKLLHLNKTPGPERPALKGQDMNPSAMHAVMGMTLPRAIIVGSWLLFMLVWAIMAIGTKKKVHEQPANERRRYTLPLLGALVFISGVLRFIPPFAFLARPFPVPILPLHWTGAVAAVAGVLIAIWARLTLGRNWSGVVTLKEDHELVTAGPYAAIRHPIYTALILLFVGTTLLVATPGAVIGLLCVIWSCWVKLKQEEALMLQQFPGSYLGYMMRTKRLVPGVI
jgi:protein-S-isoprenylcysteine O-methyltransferase Ste14